jgi:hypothetical protein
LGTREAVGAPRGTGATAAVHTSQIAGRSPSPAQLVSGRGLRVLGRSAALGGERGCGGAPTPRSQLAVCGDRRRPRRRSPEGLPSLSDGGLVRRSRCRETLPRTCRGQDCGSHPPTSMAASHKAWSDNGSVAATCPAARSALLQLTDRRRFGRSDTFGSPLRNGRLWPNRRLQPKTAFLREPDL